MRVRHQARKGNNAAKRQNRNTRRKPRHNVGRVAIRRTGSFNIQTATGVVQGVGWRHCRRVQRGDGYGYGWLAAIKPLTSKEHRLPPPAKAEGYPATKSI